MDRLCKGTLRKRICQLRHRKFESKKTLTEEKYNRKDKVNGKQNTSIEGVQIGYIPL